MASAPERDIDEYIDAEPPEPPEEEPEQPDSAEECRVSLDVIEVEGEDLAEVFAHGEPPAEGGATEERKELLAHVTASELIMFPRVSASYRPRFLEPKYNQIIRIRIPGEWQVPGSINEFDWLLEELPVGFSRRAARGLGLKWENRLIVEAIEAATPATELLLVDGDEASLSGTTFTLGRRRFERARKAMAQIGRRAQSRALADRRILAHNEIVHPVDRERFPEKRRQPRPGEIFELVQLSTRDQRRNQNDRDAATELVRRDAPQIAQENPRALLELRSEIERVTLAELIERYEALLARNPDERAWQRFFEEHPFVLSIAFPYPVLLIRGQAHVGGMTIDGRGESIADFLFRQRLTGGVAIVEIKTARSRLLQASPFRGNVYAAHADLCAAISQVLDQRSELTMNFHARARNPGMEDTHVGHVQCMVIAGRDPDDADKRRSLDLFRNATKDVAVITFDELLEKLRAIHRLMQPATPPTRAAGPVSDDELPF
jgi:hypothetical protein